MPANHSVCEICSAPFVQSDFQRRNGGGRVCSPRCRGQLVARMTSTALSKSCLFCSAPFITLPSRVADGRGLYCSKRCHDQSRLGVKKAQHPTYQCYGCGKDVVKYVNPKLLAAGRRVYCSSPCAYANRPRRDPMELFMLHVEQTDTCWWWKGPRHPNGYGRFTNPIAPSGWAHRAAYRLFVGDIAPGAFVLHSCDQGAHGCVRPDHLQLGTHRDNMHQMTERKRNKIGESHSQAKLTDAIVRDARARYTAGTTSYRALASEYGVSRTVMLDAILRRSWKHVA